MIKTIPWRIYRQHGGRYRIKATYGIDYDFAARNNQAPYFFISGEAEEQAGNYRWIDYTAGAIHSEIRAHFRALAPYLKWHLVSVDGPTHYLENAKYYFEMAQGLRERVGSEDNPVEAFKHTIVFGAFPGDEAPPELRTGLEHAAAWRAPEALRRSGPKEWSPRAQAKQFFGDVSWADVRSWLEERLPRLMAAWVVDMGELGVLEE